jgi:hypothetical protein
MNDPIKAALLLVPFEHREKVLAGAMAVARLAGEEMSKIGVWTMMVAGAMLQDDASRRKRREGGE